MTLPTRTGQKDAGDAPADNRSVLSAGVAKLQEEVPWLLQGKQAGDEQTQNINGYITGGLKTATLFLVATNSRTRWVTSGITAAIWGLDQAKVNDSLPEQAVDFTMGAGKGLATKYALGKISHSTTLDMAEKGMGIGLSSRFLDATLSRETYFNAQAGRYDAMHAGREILNKSLTPGSLALDAAVFYTGAGIAHRLQVRNNPLLNSMVTGGAFGWSSGVAGEMSKQSKSGEYSLTKILKEGAIHAAVDSVAAGPGGMMARRAARLSLAADIESNRSLGSGSGERSLRERVAVEGKVSGEAQSEALLRELDRRIRAGEVKLADLSTPGDRTTPPKLQYEMTQIKLPALHPAYADALAGKAAVPRFSSLTDFERSAITQVPTKVRVYRGEGLPEIVVAEEYAKSLDAYDTHWRNAQRLGEPGRAARAELSNQTYTGLQNRVTPHQLAEYLRLLPDAKVFKRIILSAEENPYDLWYRAKHQDSRFHSSAMDTLFNRGETTLYRGERGPILLEDLLHEWAHLFENRRPIESQMLRLAGELETPEQLGLRAYARDPREHWAIVIGENALSPTSSKPIDLLQKSPIRAAVVGDALTRALRDIPVAQRGPAYDSYVERARFLSGEATPIARSRLVEIVNADPTSAQSRTAVKLLSFLGTPEQMRLLRGTHEVDFTDTVTTDLEVSNVARVPGLRDLNLRGTHVTDQGIAELRSTQLEGLNVSGTTVSDYSLAALPKTLRNLDLSRTSISDAAVDSLGSLQGLQKLNVAGTGITSDGVSRLRALLPTTEITYE